MALAAALMLSFACGACTTDGGSAANAPPGTVAFESIDGPPPAAFDKFVQNLDRAAEAHRLAVVSRDAPAQYRVRGYLAAHVEHSRTSIVWVWDVYDAERNRALRISGREAAGGRARDWAAADEAVLRRIADDGMDQLAALVGAAPAAPTAAGGEAIAAVPADAALAFAGPAR